MVRADELAAVLGGAGAESRFLTASDGVQLHYLYWPSRPSPPWAVLIFLHGIASHAGWFGETAAHLNQHGVAVYGSDRRGSGHSGGPRGHLARYERALDDLEQVVQLVGSEHPGTPVFLAASSWAAKLAVVYVAQRPGPLSGLVLPAVVLQSRVKVSPGLRLRVLVGHLAAPMARLPIPLSPEQYTANPPYLDVHPGRSAAAAGGHGPAVLGGVRLDRRRRRASARLGLPLLVLHGEEDPMLDAQDAPLVRAAGCRGQDLPGLSGRRPQPGLRAGSRRVSGRPARVAQGAGHIRVTPADGGRSLKPSVTELELFALDLLLKIVFRHAAAARSVDER